jgi:hypothetical protein
MPCLVTPITESQTYTFIHLSHAVTRVYWVFNNLQVAAQAELQSAGIEALAQDSRLTPGLLAGHDWQSFDHIPVGSIRPDPLRAWDTIGN